MAQYPHKIKVTVCDDANQVAAAAAAHYVELFRQKAQGETNEARQIVLGFATGSTPEKTYAKLVALTKAGQLKGWENVVTFNLDEYLFPGGGDLVADAAAPEVSYRSFMNAQLFNHVPVHPWNTFVPRMFRDPGLACAAYEALLQAAGYPDLWLLGIGPNGHIGFNEPGSSVHSTTRIVELTKATIAANSDGRFFKDPKDVPTHAITAGVATIKKAKKILLLGTGAAKAAPLQAALEGPMTESVPASLLQDHPDTTFIIDRQAAGRLR